MCVASLSIPAVVATARVGTAIAGHVSERRHAAAAERVRRQQDAQARYHRREIEQFNNQIYQQDIDYAGDLLNFQRTQFNLQRDVFDDTVEAIQTDYVNQLGTLLTRAVEESIALQLFGQDAVRQGRRARASAEVAAAGRGVSGNTVDTLLGDVERQVGEALTSGDRTRAALNRQLQLEALGLKARADTAINQIPITTFQPITPPRPPAPTSPIAPTAPIPGPNPFATAGQVVTAIGQGYQDTYRNRGQTMPSSLRDTLRLRPGPARTP